MISSDGSSSPNAQKRKGYFQKSIVIIEGSLWIEYAEKNIPNAYLGT